MRNFKTLGRLSLCTLSLLLMLGSCKKDEEKTNQPPTPPELLTPQEGEKLTASQPILFSWKKSTDPEGDAITYDLYLSKSNEEGFSLLKADIHTNSYKYTENLPPSKYRWKMIAKNENGGGVKSESKVRTFTITTPELSVSNDNVTLQKGKTALIAIQSGTGDYQITSADTSKATADIVGNLITIEGKSQGTTQLTLTDRKSGKTATIRVTISLTPLDLALSFYRVSVNTEKTADITIVLGNGDYEVKSNNTNIATVSLSDDKQTLTIQGKSEGATEIVITDKVTSQSKTINVDVKAKSALLDLALSLYRVSVNIGKTADITIVLGNGDYEVKSNNTNIATVLLSNDKQALTIQGKSEGTAKIVITDKVTLQSKTINVEVKAKSALLDLDLSANNVNVNVGGTASIGIISGNGDYTITSDNKNIATASIHKNTIRIEGKSEGTTQLTLTDKKNNQSQSIKVKVLNSNTSNAITVDKIVLNKTELVKNIGESETLVPIIKPSNATNQNITWESSDTTIVSVDTEGTITALKGGKAEITATSEDGGHKAICIVNVIPEGMLITNKVLTKMYNHKIPANGNVVIPDFVTTIGDEAFYRCTKLTTITIPNSVTSIGNSAFSQTNLTSVIIPNSITSIGEGAFSNTKLTSVTIPNSITSISRYLFASCTELTSVTIPNSITSIEDNVFNGCSKLTSVTIPNSVTSIGYGAFSETNLTSVTIPNSITSIEDNVFDGCSKLTSVTIPNSVTHIGHNAFSGCYNLKSITIPNSVTNIGHNAFPNIGLTSITCLATNPPEINGDLFSKDYEGNITVPKDSEEKYRTAEGWKEYTINGKKPFRGAIEGTKLVYVTYRDITEKGHFEIPSNITEIGEDAFRYCNNLKSVTIPNSVIKIGHRAFEIAKGSISITILATTPPMVGGYLGQVDVIYVPKGSGDTYRNTKEWGYYKIVEQ